MTLPLNMGMDIDNFSGRNVDNYDNVRGHTMTSNKMSSRTISMSSSEASVDYATRMEWLNNVPDDEETREPINSSQLSYTELKEIQVSGATDQVNRVRMQWGVENAPALISTWVQCVDDLIINIQLPYNPNMSMEPELWDGSFHPISLHSSIEHLASDSKNIRDLLNHVAKYISNKQINPKKFNNVKDLKGVSEAIWNLISSVYQSSWDLLYADNNSATLRQKVASKFTPKVKPVINSNNANKYKLVPVSIEKLSPPITAKLPKEVN